MTPTAPSLSSPLPGSTRNSGDGRDLTISHHTSDLRARVCGKSIDLTRAEHARGGSEAPDETVLLPYQQGRRLTGAGEILDARRLHASVYLERGFVGAADVADDGTLRASLDPWHPASTHFGVDRGERLMATSRQILGSDVRQLPTLRLADPNTPDTRAVLRREASEVVEISGLARSAASGKHDSVALYVAMWRHSIGEGHRVWVMAVETQLFVQLRRMVCGEAIRPLGTQRRYMGGNLTPAAMFLDEASREHRRMAAERGDRWPLCGLLPHLFTPWADSVSPIRVG